MRHNRIESRPHVQGSTAPLRLRHSASELTDGAGLLLIRQLWDRLGLGLQIDRSTAGIDKLAQAGGSEMVELLDELTWRTVLLLLDSTVVERYGISAQARPDVRYWLGTHS